MKLFHKFTDQRSFIYIFNSTRLINIILKENFFSERLDTLQKLLKRRDKILLRRISSNIFNLQFLTESFQRRNEQE